jgi:hypothetical protein
MRHLHCSAVQLKRTNSNAHLFQHALCELLAWCSSLFDCGALSALAVLLNCACCELVNALVYTRIMCSGEKAVKLSHCMLHKIRVIEDEHLS